MGFFSSIAAICTKAVSVAAKGRHQSLRRSSQCGWQGGWLWLPKRKSSWKTRQGETRVKPNVEQFRVYVKLAANYAPLPWMKGALLAVDKGIDALFCL